MDKKEVLRYLRTNTKTENSHILSLVDGAIKSVEEAAQPKTIYRIFDCIVNDSSVTVGGVEFKSKRLADNMRGCKRAVVFGATLGLGVDRLIKTSSATDMAKAMAQQAAAATLIEEVCDCLEENIKKQYGVSLRRRYSPGYFDLDVTEQRKLFSLVDITKRIGITLADSCQMMPSKSVTAFIGIEEK